MTPEIPSVPTKLSRREVVKAAAATALVGAWPHHNALAQAAGASNSLNLLLAVEPSSLFIGLVQNQPTQFVAGKIYESLLTYDFQFKPQPGLAKSWDVSEDRLTYTFHLYDNVVWHDGTPFTADDVVFTTKEFLTEVHPITRAVFQNCKSIEALDRNTVRFVLKEPSAAFLSSFETPLAPIVPAHLYRGTNFRTNPNNQKPIGTGPFKLAEWRKGSVIHLTRHTAYYRQNEPRLENLYFHVIPDAASRTVALEQGRIQQSQFLDIDLLDARRLSKAPHLKLITEGYEYFAALTELQFNTRNAPFNDRRFRQAFAHAIDRQAITDRIFHGFGRPATGPISSRGKFYEPQVRRYAHDPARATALLDEIGLKPDARGIRARARFLPLFWGETFLRLAEFLRQSLLQVGIELVIEPADVATFTTRYGNWDFDIINTIPYQNGDPALGIWRAYVSSNIRKGVAFTNVSGYTHAQVDEWFAQGARARTTEERRRIYGNIQKQIVEDLPVLQLVELDFPTLIDKRYEDVVTTANGVNGSYRLARRGGQA